MASGRLENTVCLQSASLCWHQGALAPSSFWNNPMLRLSEWVGRALDLGREGSPGSWGSTDHSAEA